MEEIWKDIPGYDGYYQVSNLGRIKSLPRGKQWPYRQTHNNIRKPRLATNGYFKINLSKGNIVKWFGVHRLVAMAFIPNPDNFPRINHKDENKLNNCVDNLEWCTYKYNANYGAGVSRQKESRKKNPNDVMTRKLVGIKNRTPIKCWDKDGNFIGFFRSTTEAAERTGVDKSSVSGWCSGRRTKVRKFRFAKADEILFDNARCAVLMSLFNLNYEQ